MRRLLAYAAVYILWGGTFLAVRTVVLVTPPFAAAGIRFVIGGLILLAVSRLRSGLSRGPTRAEWIDSAKLGLVMFTVNYATFFWAEQRLYSGIASIVVATLSVWMMLAERVLGVTRRVAALSLVGSALGIVGVVLAAGVGEGSRGPSTGRSGVAVLVLMSGTACWAFGSVWSRRLRLPVDQTLRSALQMTTGGCFLCVLSLAAGEGRAAVPALLAWTPTVLLAFVYLVFASVMAFTSYVWLLHHEPANRVASYAYVNPLIALALGVGLAHEQIGPRQLLGAAFVLTGVFATLHARPSPTAASAAEAEAA